jgi:hypothetical protein
MSSDSSSIFTSFRQGLEDRLVRRALVIAGLAGLMLVIGLVYYWQHNTSAGQTLNAQYGRRTGRGADSVNGTAVLAHMFELSGFQVRTATRLSPRIYKEADVLVWFPGDFQPPTKKQREYLERWLAGGSERTLVYVGRDYDAASHYWNAVLPIVAGEDAKRVAELAAAAKAAHESQRAAISKQTFARWFTVKGGGRERTVKQLSGPWAPGVDPSQVHIPLRGRLDVPLVADAEKEDPLPPDETEPLLTGNGDVLAFRARDFAWSDGQLIVVANGSFLLNYPLINKQHRKLAGKLIDECSGTRVVFLESGPGGPEILENDPPETGGLAMLRIWPLNAIILHLTIFGMVYCLARWPIFGRPKELAAENPADFGRHVKALGQLMARSKDLAYAQSRLAQYQQQSRRGSGSLHGK